MADGVSHFSMIGFDLDVANEAAFSAAIEEVVQSCEMIRLAGPYDLCLVRDQSGGELWIGLAERDDGAELITANPAFRGSGKLSARVDGFVSDPAWEPFEYKVSVTFSDFDIPLLLELADPREKDRLAKGTDVTLDVTGFTYEPQIFDNDEAYVAAQRADRAEAILAPDHFIPSGLFGDEPSPYAMFGGTILQSELRRGSDGSQYWWALVSTQSGATVNVVFDDVSTTVAPEVGKLLVGEFWMTARLALAAD
jgi:hypothetical protein